MTDILSTLSSALEAAAASAAASVVQVQTRRQPVAGVVFDSDFVLTLAKHVDDESVAVRRPDGQVLAGVLLGRDAVTGIAVVRVEGLGAPVVRPAATPRPGHLALAIGRTWSGNLFAALAPVAVVGGPLRAGRRGELAQVIRIGLAPHGALTGGALVDGAGGWLGLVTPAAIRGTTVVIPAAIALEAARALIARGGTRQGYLGVSTAPVTLAAGQRTETRHRGLLVTGVFDGGPADAAGALVGDVILALDGTAVADAEALIGELRGDRVDRATPLTVLRGAEERTLTVTVTERRHG